MPYESHQELETPSDDTTLWRYMDFTKFVDLLESSQLHLSGFNELNDKLEGYLTAEVVEMLRKRPPDCPIDWDQWKEFVDRTLEGYKEERGFFRVSCWHENENESAAMWKLYLKSDEGIAVRTTAGRLKQALQQTPEPLFIGRVQYRPVQLLGDVMIGNAMRLAIHKRKSFEHEHEVRVTSFYWNESGRITVDLDSLIESVWLAPGTLPWIRSLVESILRRYSFTKKVFPSALDECPAY